MREQATRLLSVFAFLVEVDGDATKQVRGWAAHREQRESWAILPHRQSHPA